MAPLLGTGLRSSLGRSVVYGRQPTPAPKPYQEMGVAGTAVWGGYIQVKERSPEWIGRQKWITASELAVNTSIAAAGVHYFLNLVAYPKWTFSPHDDGDEESLALAEFADHVLNNMNTPFYKVIRRAAMYRFYGFGLQEWTAKHRDDGLIGFKDIENRPQHTIEQWDVDVDGTVLGVWQRSPQTGHMLGLPRDKLLYLVEDTLTDNPEGLGMFRHMADPYRRLKQLQELEIRAYERDLRGIPIARAPLTYINRAVSQGVITDAEAKKMIADMQAMVQLQVKQSDTGLVLDSLPYFSDSDAGDQVSALPQWGFELLNGAGVGHGEIAAAIDRVQREIARIIGVEHLMMGDTGGNRALSEDKSRNLYLIANSVLKYIASAVKSDILVPLWRLNGFPMDKMPEPKPEDVTFKNAEAITNALGKLASAGAPLAPTDPVINDIRELMGVAPVPEELMQQAAAQPMNPALAGIPPELQALFGGKGSPAGPGAGPKPNPFGPAGGPQGGGAAPGKKPPFGKKGPLPDPREEEQPPDRINQQQANGTEAPKSDAGGKIEVDAALLVRLLGRLVGDAPQPAITGQRNPGDPAGGDRPDAASLAAEVQTSTSEAKPQGTLAGGTERPKPAAGKEPGEPSAPADAARPDAGKPAGDEAAGPSGGPVADAAAPDADQPGKPGDKPAAEAKEGEPGKDAKPVVGAGAQQPAVAGGPGGQPVPQPPGAAGQPGAVDPATGQPLPQGQTPSPQEEMTPEKASEILQPYAEGNPTRDPKTVESDNLYVRLGSEKDVQAAVSDADPMDALDGVRIGIDGEAPIDGGKPLPDGELAVPDESEQEEADARAQLMQMLGAGSDEEPDLGADPDADAEDGGELALAADDAGEAGEDPPGAVDQDGLAPRQGAAPAASKPKPGQPQPGRVKPRPREPQARTQRVRVGQVGAAPDDIKPRRKRIKP